MIVVWWSGKYIVLAKLVHINVLGDEIMDILYKYKSFPVDCNERNLTLDNLRNDKIWYCNPKYFNDIFDTSFFIDQCRAELSYSELKKRMDEGQISKTQFDATISTLNQDIAILSLTTSCTNNAMWAHYADYHTGFCMGFEFEEGEVAKRCPKVNYVEEYQGGERLIMNPTSWINLFTQKSVDWEKEDEYRLILSIDNLSETIKLVNFLIDYFDESYVKSRLEKIKNLLSTQYVEICRDEVMEIIKGIKSTLVSNIEIELLSVLQKALINKGKLHQYPGRLASITFGYRMPLEDKLCIKQALSHKAGIRYEKIVMKMGTYQLTTEEEKFE